MGPTPAPAEPPVRTIDARGHRCPTPTLRLQRALREVAPGGLVELYADDPMARIDVAHFAQQNGHHLVSLEVEAQMMVFRIRKAAAIAP